MKLTLTILENFNPCLDGLEWWKKSKCETVESTIAQLFKEEKLDWASWLIARMLTHDGQIKYAIYAVRQVLDIYEKQYPGDTRPRRAIEAREEYLADKTEAKMAAARAAGAAAWAAARAAWDVARAAGGWTVSEAAAWAVARDVAEAAAWVAAWDVAGAAAWAAARAAEAAAEAAMKKKIIEYGLSII